MTIIKLKPTDEGVDFFSSLFLAKDHNSQDHHYSSLFKVLTIWKAGMYHVYVPLMNNVPIGVMHGSYTEGDFHGHLYVMENERKFALRALKEVIKFICDEMPTDRIFAGILDTNKPAQVLVCAAGFKRIEKEKYLLEI